MKKATVPLVYLGRRMHASGAEYFQVFRDAAGDERLHNNIRGVWIGSTYLGFKDAIYKRPEAAPENAKIVLAEKEHQELEARDSAVDEWLRKRRAQNAAIKKVKELSKTKRIRALKREVQDLTKNMHWFEREQFVEFLARPAQPKRKK